MPVGMLWKFTFSLCGGVIQLKLYHQDGIWDEFGQPLVMPFGIGQLFPHVVDEPVIGSPSNEAEAVTLQPIAAMSLNDARA